MRTLALGLLLAAALFAQEEELAAIPQVADGGGWQTRIVLVNQSLTLTATATLRFFGQNGLPWSVPIVGPGPVSNWNLTIPPGGSMILVTQGIQPNVQAGWLEIRSGAPAREAGYDPNTNQVLPARAAQSSVLAFVAFRHRVEGFPDYEASVFSIPAETQRIAFALDNMEDYVTSVAVANTQASPTPVTVTFRNAAGQVFFQDTINLAGMGHAFFETTNRFAESQNQRGTVEFATNTGRLAALCLWFNPNGPFTSIPNLTFQ